MTRPDIALFITKNHLREKEWGSHTDRIEDCKYRCSPTRDAVEKLVHDSELRIAEEWSKANRHHPSCHYIRSNVPTCDCGAHDKLRILEGEFSAAYRFAKQTSE